MEKVPWDVGQDEVVVGLVGGCEGKGNGEKQKNLLFSWERGTCSLFHRHSPEFAKDMQVLLVTVMHQAVDNHYIISAYTTCVQIKATK